MLSKLIKVISKSKLSLPIYFCLDSFNQYMIDCRSTTLASNVAQTFARLSPLRTKMNRPPKQCAYHVYFIQLPNSTQDCLFCKNVIHSKIKTSFKLRHQICRKRSINLQARLASTYFYYLFAHRIVLQNLFHRKFRTVQHRKASVKHASDVKLFGFSLLRYSYCLDEYKRSFEC